MMIKNVAVAFNYKFHDNGFERAIFGSEIRLGDLILSDPNLVVSFYKVNSGEEF